jgi:outer membrane protein OmpA-like peptidoglycan-associated protein
MIHGIVQPSVGILEDMAAPNDSKLLTRRARLIPCVLLMLLIFVSIIITRADATEGSVTFNDYPRYGTDVSALPPAVQQGMKNFATGLVGAVIAGQSVDVTVIGHADFDAQGSDFEIDVSRQRAAGAESALETFFNQASDVANLSAQSRRLVTFVSIGVGTQRPVVPHPLNEDDRKANRRVEFVFNTTALPPPDPLATFQSCVRVLATASPAGPARRMTCVCNKLLQPSPPFVKSYFYDFQAAQQARAGAGAMSQFTPEQMTAFYRNFMHFARQEIQKFSGSSDADLRAGLIQIDDVIGRNLNDFLSQAELGAGPFEHGVSVDIVKSMQDPNHTYSCYAGYSRRNSDL